MQSVEALAGSDAVNGGDRGTTFEAAGPGSLRRTLARNSLLNAAGLGAPLVIAVFAIPPIVAGLGAARFGILGLIWVALAYLNMLDLGLGRATTRASAAVLAVGRDDQVPRIVATAAALQLALGIVGEIGATLLAGPLVDLLVNASGPLRQEALGSFLVLAAAGPLVAPANSFRGALEAAQEFALVNAIRVPLSAGNFLVPLLGVHLGWSLPHMVFWMVALRGLGLLGFAGAAWRRWPGLFRRGRPEPDVMKELASFGGWVTVSSVVGSLLVYLDRIMVGALLSVAAVGYYTVPHEMVTRLAILPSAFVATLFPALSSAHSGGGKAGTLVARSTALMLGSVGILLVALAVASPRLLTVWLGPDFAREAALPLTILAFGMLANAVAYVFYAAVHAAGRPDVTARIHLLELPLHVALLWALLSTIGVPGAAIAWSGRMVLDAGLLLFAMRALGVVDPAQWRGSGVGRAGTVLLSFTGVALLLRWLVVGAWAGIIAIALAAAVALAGTAFALVSPAEWRGLVARRR